MSLRITDDAMTSDQTRHTALRADQGWELSWLPGQVLDRNQAVTGMTLAETVAGEDLHPDNPAWLHIDDWAHELGLTGPDAVVRASEPVQS